MATSMIAANLPDIDVLVFASDVPSVAFRRGWTHGLLAQAVFPAVLAGFMVAIARRRVHAHDASPPAALAPLLVLSYVGVLLHVFLDFLNNYGVRLLMPFSARWFYGDTLFIIDPWLWLVFLIAVLLGRNQRTRIPRICLFVAAMYITIMLFSAHAARTVVADGWRRDTGTNAQSLMVGPVPINPFRKAVIIDAGDRYHTGTFRWADRRTSLDDQPIIKNDGHPAVAAARHDPRIAGILIWARFPFWDIRTAAGGTLVTVGDVRFAGFRMARGGFGAATLVRPVDGRGR
jgi:inner membrane protein